MSQIQKASYPIITGRPDSAKPAGQLKPRTGPSFQTILEQSLQKQAPAPLTFSRHALQRTEQRNIGISETDMNRLGSAVGKAEDKGLKDTLVFMDNNAFIINIPNRVVVTVVDSSETENTVFTNIDGAIIV